MIALQKVEPDVTRVLTPGVIDYLWKLALLGERAQLACQWFYLCPHPSNLRVQQVAHIYGHNNFRRWNSTFCEAPATGFIRVTAVDAGHRMEQVDAWPQMGLLAAGEGKLAEQPA